MQSIQRRLVPLELDRGVQVLAEKLSVMWLVDKENLRSSFKIKIGHVVACRIQTHWWFSLFRKEEQIRQENNSSVPLSHTYAVKKLEAF